jgi:FSR family fosmidomycin resistance protein-like MFS transporter
VIHEPQSVHTTITGLAAAHLVTDIYMPVLPAILPLLILHNGYSYLAAGLLVTAYNVTSSFTQPVLGWLSDSKGLTVNLSISLLISAVFVALMGVATNYYMIMLFAVLAALGHACFHPAALSLVSRLCTSENRGQVTSYFVVGGNVGYALGPILAGARLLAGSFWTPAPHIPGPLHGMCPALFPAGGDCRGSQCAHGTRTGYNR